MPRLLLFILVFLIAASPVFALEWPMSPGKTPFEPTCDPKIDPPHCTPSTLTQMVRYFYEWAIVLGGLAAFIMLLVAGFQYLTSTGDPAKTKEARERIGSAIGGLALLLSSFLVLNILNPEFTTLRVLPPLSLSPSSSDEDIDKKIEEGLPPRGSCQSVKIYPKAKYKGQVTTVEVKRDSKESDPTNLSPILPQQNGSVQFFSYLTDESKEVKAGGLCLVDFYKNKDCPGTPHYQLAFETPNLGQLQIQNNTACAKVSSP